MGDVQELTSLKSDVDEIQEEGNRYFKTGDYERALEMYERAISIRSDLPALYLNKALACLRSERHYDAYEAAAMSLERGGDREKALYRMGLAAYAMRDWTRAVKHLEAACEEFPQNSAALKELERARTRLEESRTGRFDFKAMYVRAIEKRERELDVADYMGPIEIADVEGKGQGIIASAPIRKGTLIAVCKAFASAYGLGVPGISIRIVGSVEEARENNAEKKLTRRVAERLQKNPRMSKEVYALYPGPDLPRDEQIADDVIDLNRIRLINEYNAFGGDPSDLDVQFGRDALESRKGACHLFTLASYFNHSCMANAHRTLYGDVMVVHALTDLKRGDEITVSYLSPLNDYAERERTFRKWRFTCHCRLCEADRLDSKCAKRARLLKRMFDVVRDEAVALETRIAEGEKILKQIRNAYEAREDHKIDLVQALVLIASRYNDSHKPQRSIECLEEALSLLDEELAYTVEIAQMRLNLAVCYWRLRRLAEAHENMRAAFALSHCVDREHFMRVFQYDPNLEFLLD